VGFPPEADQVSGVSKYRILNTDLVAGEDQHRWKQVHFMGNSDTAGRIRLLTPCMKLNEFEKRTAACDELSRVEPKNVEY
jgi:hypothetical protein